MAGSVEAVKTMIASLLSRGTLGLTHRWEYHENTFSFQQTGSERGCIYNICACTADDKR
jgi:hypothetical protein